jgi:hypothetical protein
MARDPAHAAAREEVHLTLPAAPFAAGVDVQYAQPRARLSPVILANARRHLTRERSFPPFAYVVVRHAPRRRTATESPHLVAPRISAERRSTPRTSEEFGWKLDQETKGRLTADNLLQQMTYRCAMRLGWAG